jgi:hypothetical protein
VTNPDATCNTTNPKSKKQPKTTQKILLFFYQTAYIPDSPPICSLGKFLKTKKEEREK